MHIKGLMIIQNVKTRMPNTAKYVMAKYCTLVHKMHEDRRDLTTTHDTREAAKANYDSLVDVSR